MRDAGVPLSLVMPCYNEAACIEEVVSSWMKEISSKISDFEMVVVDDGSRDATPEVLKKLAARFPRLHVIRQENQGHGPALWNAYRAARGGWVFHTDSDRQSVPEDFWKLWSLRERSPYVMGHRVNRDDPTHRLILTSVVRFFVRVFLFVPVRDANIPYKLIRSDVLNVILSAIPPKTLAPSILMVVAAHRLGIEIAQTDVRHLPRTTGKTVLRPWRLLRFCAQAFGQLTAFSFSYWPKRFSGKTA